MAPGGRKAKLAFTTFRRTAIRNAMRGKGPVWTVLAAGFIGGRVVRRKAGREEEIVYTRSLEPGEALEIRHSPMSYGADAKATKAQRKAAKRQR